MVPLGVPAEALDTPALCLDLDMLESNIRAVAALAASMAWAGGRISRGTRSRPSPGSNLRPAP